MNTRQAAAKKAQSGRTPNAAYDLARSAASVRGSFSEASELLASAQGRIDPSDGIQAKEAAAMREYGISMNAYNETKELATYAIPSQLWEVVETSLFASGGSLEEVACRFDRVVVEATPRSPSTIAADLASVSFPVGLEPQAIAKALRIQKGTSALFALMLGVALHTAVGPDSGRSAGLVVSGILGSLAAIGWMTGADIAKHVIDLLAGALTFTR